MPRRFVVTPRRAASLSALAWLVSATTAQQFARYPVAQGDFAATAPTPIDLDGDGDPDFVTVVGNGRLLAHCLNRGGSRCAQVGTTSAVGLVAFSDRRPATADFDGDGDVDLVLNNGNARGVLLRNQQGQLSGGQTPLPQPAAGMVLGMRVLDADQDGDPDLLVRTPTGMEALLNDGAAGFSPAPGSLLPPATSPGIVEPADLDGDGATDVLVVDNATPRLWMSRAGGMVDETAARLPVGTPNIRLAAVDDIDNDGDRDLILLEDVLPLVGLVLRNNGGVFTAVPGALPNLPVTAASMLTLDLDGDGDRDLVVDRAVLTNDGSGTFTPGLFLGITPIAAIDLDGDRFTDALTTTSLARNDGGRDLVPLQRCWGLAAGDLDDDGDMDVLGTNTTRWVTEGSRLTMSQGMPTLTPAVRLVDLDRDGDVDLIERSSMAVSVQRNDGTGTFTPWFQTNSQSLRAGLVATLDLDRDGDLDLAWSNGTFGSSAPTVARNDGQTFTDVTAQVLAPGTVFGAVTIEADLDADGLVDLMVGNLLSTVWLRNQGNGTLANASARMPTGFGGEVLLPIQIDGDPELELLAVRNPTLLLADRVGQDWVNVSWRLPGSAGPATGAVPLDFDSDGDLDLAIAGGGGFLLANDGTGVFSDVTMARGPFTATALTAFDVDGDGDPDVLDGLDLWLNQQRQLALAAPVGVGGRLALEFVGEAGFGTGAVACVTTLGGQRSRRGTPLLGGTLLPDPSGNVILGVPVSAGGSPAALSVPVPAIPGLRGLVLQIQGLVIGSRGELNLANHLVVTID